MNGLIILVIALNFFLSLIVFFTILNNNNDDFIKWVKDSLDERNWFGKLQICLLIIWLLPVIILVLALLPMSWILSKIAVGVILGCMKIVELGKK